MLEDSYVENQPSRRSLLWSAAATILGSTVANASPPESDHAPKKLKVAIFSKHLLFVQGDALANAAAEIGFDGIDLAVRKGGHVEPDRVRQDLPPLVATIRRRGLEVPMLTTDIADTESPFAEDILRTMSDLGIHHYRWGGFKYAKSSSISDQLPAFRSRAAKLAELNARYNATAMYHTHSGIGLVGAPIWDLHEILHGLDPNAVAVNYDIGHATVEGGFGGWIDSLNITGPYLRGIAVKDFLWEKDAHNNWRPAWKPLGEGMVRLPEFFKMIASANFFGPVQLHFEYPLAGADEGKTDIGAHKDQVFAAMKRDLKQLRSYLAKAHLA